MRKQQAFFFFFFFFSIQNKWYSRKIRGLYYRVIYQIICSHWFIHSVALWLSFSLVTLLILRIIIYLAQFITMELWHSNEVLCEKYHENEKLKQSLNNTAKDAVISGYWRALLFYNFTYFLKCICITFIVENSNAFF